MPIQSQAATMSRTALGIWCAVCVTVVSLVWLVIALLTAVPQPVQQVAQFETSYAIAPFGKVPVYRPIGEPRGTALFLSGDSGWNGGMARLARAFADNGLLVAGISTPALMKALEAGPAKCIDVNYALIGLARDVQHRERVRAYMQPILAGYSAGATVVYASIAQWPTGSYRGAFSLGFSADNPGKKAWCRGPGFSAHRTAKPLPGWLFAPNPQIKVPWFVLQGEKDEVVDYESAKRFVAQVPGAHFLNFPALNHDFSDHLEWLPTMTELLGPMLAPLGPQGGSLDDMPLAILPATGGERSSDVMAIIYSGDGGWVGIDRDIAGQLSARGIPVVGVDSLSYFWTARTSQGAARDLQRIINAYSRMWNRPRILLIGYSFGADALPAIVDALDPAMRGQIESLSLLGFGKTADFQFHLSSWLDISSAQSQPTLPSILRLKGMRILCVRGALETDSACPTIPKTVAQTVVVPGGHHFDRNAPLLTSIILSHATARLSAT